MPTVAITPTRRLRVRAAPVFTAGSRPMTGMVSASRSASRAGPGRGVAGHDDDLRPRRLEVPAHGQGALAHLVHRAVAVRAVRGVGDVEEVLGGKGAPDLAGDAQPADPGIEDAHGRHPAHYAARKTLDPAAAPGGILRAAAAHRPTPSGHPPHGLIGAKGFPDLGSCACFLVHGIQAGAGAVRPGDKHMTQASKLKQAIRARSAKTGESYTAARQQVLKARQKRKAAAHVARPRRRPARPAVRASAKRRWSRRPATGSITGSRCSTPLAPPPRDTPRPRAICADEHGVPGLAFPGHHGGLRAGARAARGEPGIHRVPGVGVEDGAGGHGRRAGGPARPGAQEVAGRRRSRAASRARARAGRRREGRGPRPQARARALQVGRGPTSSWSSSRGGRAPASSPSNTRLRDAAQVAERRAQWRVALDALKAHAEPRPAARGSRAKRNVCRQYVPRARSPRPADHPGIRHDGGAFTPTDLEVCP